MKKVEEHCSIHQMCSAITAMALVTIFASIVIDFVHYSHFGCLRFAIIRIDSKLYFVAD